MLIDICLLKTVFRSTVTMSNMAASNNAEAIDNEICQMLSQSLKTSGSTHHKEKVLRVKVEFKGENRALTFNRPVQFEDVVAKITSLLGVEEINLYCTMANGEVLGALTKQGELDGAIQLVDHSDKYRSLRLLVTLLNDQEVFGVCNTLRADSATSPASNEEQVSLSSGSDPPYRRTGSPPPGSLHPSDEILGRSPSIQSEGEFIPEDGLAGTNHSMTDSSYSGSRHSIMDRSWTQNSSGAGSRLSVASDSQIQQSDEYSASHNRTKGGTYPLRVAPNAYKNDPRNTAPRMRPSMDVARYNHQLTSQSSSSSGLTSDFDSPHQGMQGKQRSPQTPNQWRKGPELGRGAFGTVYKCMDQKTGKEFALKEVVLGTPGGSNDEVSKEAAALENEIRLYRAMTNHPRLVQYLGADRTATSMFIFLEFVPGGSVKDQLRQFGALTTEVVSRYTRQILQGLSYLHQKSIIHRDIKAANILRDVEGNIKLSDFGASRRLLTIATHTGVRSFCGTPYWMAPEVIRGEMYSYAADIWSMGATVVEMLTTKPPFAELEPYAALFKIAHTSSVDFDSIIHNVCRDCEHFLMKSFTPEIDHRPDADELLKHAFVNSQQYDL